MQVHLRIDRLRESITTTSVCVKCLWVFAHEMAFANNSIFEFEIASTSLLVEWFTQKADAFASFHAKKLIDGLLFG